jgi:hypothetical protein
MVRRDATIPQDADLLTEELLGAVPKEPEPEPEPEDERRITPHERERKTRQMSLTFPSAAWRTEIANQSKRWKMRPSDFIIFAVSYTMQAIEQGIVQRPEGEVDQFRQRAGEGLTLPWEPEEP